MELLKNTLFINLDHRQDRLEHIVKEFALLGIAGERMKAVKLNQGAIGCSLSHIKCLELAKTRGFEQVFICEDDIQFTNPTLLLENLTKFHENKDIQWDVLLIGGNNCPPYIPINDYCIRVQNCRSAVGYIVKQHYYDKIISNFKEGVQHLLKDPTNKRMYAVDMYWNHLQQPDNWYMITPLTVTQMPDYSDIEKREVNYQELLLDLDKTKFFQNQIQGLTLSQLNDMKIFIK
jgi:glycosyl transferase family 25